MYKSKYPSLIDFLINQEDLILLDSEIQNIENLIDKDIEKQLILPGVSQRSELLLAFDTMREFDIKHDDIEESIDYFLKHKESYL
tara:strand:+ start:165 stop:419 length:255 start_codon:yes stop_codon:yes gene_type:complete